jgi:AAHS family cis,cis-muconate transporter-like MFS transporter
MEVWVAICAFIALVVDGMDLQMLSLALPVLMKELNISKVAAGALST